MRRAHDEYLFAGVFALVVGLFLGVVIWNTEAAGGKSSDQFPVSSSLPDVATDKTVATTEAPATSSKAERKKPIDSEAVGSAIPSPTERIPEIAGVVKAAQPQIPTESPTQPDRPAFVAAATYPTPAPVISARSFGWPAGVGAAASPGAYYPTGGAKAKSSEQGSLAEDAPHAVPQSTSRQKLTVADAAPAEVAAASSAEVAAAPTSANYSSGPAISTLSVPLAATLDNFVPPSAVFENASWPALDSSSPMFDKADMELAESVLRTPDVISQLVKSYDPVAALAQPDLGSESPFTVVALAEVPVANPEPATLLMLGSGLGIIARRLRRRG